MEEIKTRKEPFGRPTTYKPEYCEMLIKHMEEGLSFESFAAIVDSCKPTIYSWTEKFPDFLNAKRRGTEKSRMFWEKMGRDNAVTSGDKKLNSAVWVFNMKNRFREEWTDQKNITIIDNSKEKEELLALKERLAVERQS